MDTVPIDFGTKHYELRFDNAAAFAFEEHFGGRLGVYEFFSKCRRCVEVGDDALAPTFTEIVVMLWAMAKGQSKSQNLSLDKIKSEVQPSDFIACMRAIIESYVQSLPKAAAQGDDSSPLAGTSTPSPA